METNIFDIFSLICIRTFGKKILKQLYLHTAFIRLLIVEACLFIEIVTLGSSYGSTILADDICKALFSLSILSFVVIFVFIGISAYLTFEQDHNPLERSNENFPNTNEDDDTIALAKKISVMTKLLGFISGFFMILYCYRLFDRYNADLILMLLTSIDFFFDFLEIILVILETSGILSAISRLRGSLNVSVNHSDDN